jgi:hypothetical protein
LPVKRWELASCRIDSAEASIDIVINGQHSKREFSAVSCVVRSDLAPPMQCGVSIIAGTVTVALAMSDQGLGNRRGERKPWVR